MNDKQRVIQPGWRADPTGRFGYRYYNGWCWTADVLDQDGMPLPDDPLAASFGPPTGHPVTATPQSAPAPEPSTPRWDVKPTRKWAPYVLIGLAALGVLGLVIGGCSGGGGGRSSVSAELMCEQFITERLKSPGTAKLTQTPTRSESSRTSETVGDWSATSTPRTVSEPSSAATTSARSCRSATTGGGSSIWT
jgi:hypothetical protein